MNSATGAVLARDVSRDGHCAGDVVKIIKHHHAPGSEDDNSIEVFNAVGNTVTVVTVQEYQVEAPHVEDRLCVRQTAALAA